MDDIAKLFNRSNPLNSLKINGKTFIEVAGGNGKTVKMFEGVSDAEVKKLAENLAGKPLQEVRLGMVWTATAADGTIINLRNISSSAGTTGAKWTIELPNSTILTDSKGFPIKLEIKFK